MPMRSANSACRHIKAAHLPDAFTALSNWIGAALSTASPELCVAGTQVSHEMDASNSARSRGVVLAWG